MFKKNTASCMQCKRRKVKCNASVDGACSRCINLSLTCNFTNQQKRGPKKHLSSFITKAAAKVDKFRSPYISAACLPCARAKTRCSGGTPCDRCISTGNQCNIMNQNKRGPKTWPYKTEFLDFNDKNKINESINNLEFPLICSLCGKSGDFKNDYYQCEMCIDEFGLGNSGNQIIDDFLRSTGEQFQWIPYNCFRDIKYLSKGGFGVVYKAKWKHIEVFLKSLYNSDNINVDFLKEADSHKKFKNYNGVVQIYGITHDPFNKNYSMVTKYVSGGNLYDYLKKSYNKLTWKNKIKLLFDIVKSLKVIHDKNLVHRDLHSGNIYIERLSNRDHAFIGDLGLCKPANESTNSKLIYGVVPYIAPEVFNEKIYTKATDIYSFGMLMWEFTSGQKPFANQSHNTDLILKILDGHRPIITGDTPECFKKLMVRCWNNNPLDRPNINELYETLIEWKNSGNAQFEEAESLIKMIIRSSADKTENMEFIHSEAIYTSRLLSNMLPILRRRTYVYSGKRVLYNLIKYDQ
ncbi:kinase-like domain-containing protein [Gigaspora rosea]|uniref:Kinase-like domain-containing protein n=1 Tax=Gigaspora rosea TaxID=44941 RepID=A0A397TSZ9_9GLOM|nr:kinase-like domain-containing protein [Gigaspora rosea]